MQSHLVANWSKDSSEGSPNGIKEAAPAEPGADGKLTDWLIGLAGMNDPKELWIVLFLLETSTCPGCMRKLGLAEMPLVYHCLC